MLINKCRLTSNLIKKNQTKLKTDHYINGIENLNLYTDKHKQKKMYSNF